MRPDVARGGRRKDPSIELLPAPASARRWLFALAWGLPIAVIAIALIASAASGDWPGAGSRPAASVAMLALLVVIITGAWAGLAALLRRHRLDFDADGIDLRTMFHRRRLPWPRLRLDEARVIDLEAHAELKPRLKLFGTALPGFRSGWFLLRDRRRAFVAMAGGPRVLWIPTGEREGLLLQPGRPQALLDALRARAADGARPR